MVYKKYIERNGKRYGPYIYQSKRVNGKVVSEYKGVEERQSYKKFFLIFLGIFLLVILFSFLIFFNKGFSGNAVLNLENNYNSGENLNGILNFKLEKGEFIPSSTKVVVNNSGEVSEYLLKDLIEENPTQGNYSVKGTSISGFGLGYGFEKIYPEVYFILEIYSNKTNNFEINQTKGNGVVRSNSSVVQGDNKTIEENNSEKKEVDKVIKEKIKENLVDEKIKTKTPENSSSEEEIPLIKKVVEKTLKTASEFFLSLTVTGNSVVEFTDIFGEVSKDNNFIYKLQEGEIPKVQLKSVKTDSKDLSDDSIVLKIEGGEVLVSTNYSEDIGKDFNLSLEKLNLIAKEGELEINFVYENKTFLSLRKHIDSENLGNQYEENDTFYNETINLNETSDLNKSKPDKETNFTFENISNSENQVLLKEFGNDFIQIKKSELFKDRFIIGYKLGNFEIEYSYNSKESKNILDSQIKEDRIKWLKDIAYVLSQKESPSKNIDYLVEKNITFFN